MKGSFELKKEEEESTKHYFNNWYFMGVKTVI